MQRSRDEIASRARELLRQMLGEGVRFRPGQLEAILECILGSRRLLVVQKTGWGKSVVYFILSKLIREQGGGMTLLISPLLSLMRNQVQMAERIGVHASTYHSANREEWENIHARMAEGRCDILLISPERLGNAEFVEGLLTVVRARIGLFVVDEAHCISDWGHDFRPDYRRIPRIAASLPPNIPMLATTATANDRVLDDVASTMGNMQVLRGPLGRDSLRLEVMKIGDQARRMAWLAQHLRTLPGSGIIYCLTIKDCERLAEFLRSEGHRCEAYHGDKNELRPELEQALLKNEVKALVATVALGMGFDKPDLGFVIHYQRPGSVVAYYQQIGRAGRAIDDAVILLMHGKEDDDITDYFIRTAFPPIADTEKIVRLLEDSHGLKQSELMARLNLPMRRLDQALRILQVEGCVMKDGAVYRRTANPWQNDVTRVDRVTAQRRGELERMQEYCNTRDCLMNFLVRELDDPAPEPCGRCMNCAGPKLPRDFDEAALRRAITFLKRDHIPIQPRLKWPAGASSELRGKIPVERRIEQGYALAVYGDPGWGKLVADGKYRHGHYPDELVEAAADLVRNHWRPDPAPRWVTVVPSLRHSRLVPEFAERLARALGLQYTPALCKVRETKPQKEMENSVQQLTNLVGAYEAIPDASLSGPVLLVDDMVDSRWTFTYTGYLLLEAGAERVLPLALAASTSREG